MSYRLLVTYTTLLCLGWSSVAVAKIPNTETEDATSSPDSPRQDDNSLTPTGVRFAEAIAPSDRVWMQTPAAQKSPVEITPSPPDLLAQSAPPPIPPGILEPERPRLPPLPQTLPTPIPTTPLTPPETPPATPETPAEVKIKVQQVQVLGSTVFSPEELKKVVAPFEGKELTFEELLTVRTVITDLYTSKGYTTSGAFLPPQDISTGMIQVQVVEGELEKVEIQGLRRLQENYVRSRIRLAGDTPLNISRLEQALQLLQLDPLFSRVQAELKAGTTPGRSVLTLNLTEANPLQAAYLLDNRESPSVGSVRNNAIFSHQNLLGLGDRLSAEAGFTQGVNSYAVNYDIPLNARNGTLNLQYSRSRQTVIEEPFAPLDLNSNTQTISLGFRQPLTLTPTNEFALGLSADLRRSRTFIGDIPFSFTTGPENGRSQVTVLRFSQDWVERGQQRVLAARSQFSLGLDALGATVNDTGTDGRFFSWVGQFQWVQSLGNNVVSIARVATQLTGDSLLPLEQFSIGGIDTVRGYRQNQRVGDSGIVGNFEVRFPVVNKPDGIGLIQIVPFFDIGTIWNNSSEDTKSNTLLSTGLGLRWQVGSYFEARLDWGIPLKNISQPGDTLQDNGIFFSIRLNPF